MPSPYAAPRTKNTFADQGSLQAPQQSARRFLGRSLLKWATPLALVLLTAQPGASAQTVTDTTCSAATSKGPYGNQPNWQSVCWIDFSKLSGPAVTGFDPTPSPSLPAAGQNFRVKLTDGSTLSFNVKPAAINSTTWVAAAAPSWEGAAIGSAASYTGIPGRPILRYQNASAPTNGLVFSNIAMTDSKGNPVTNFRFLAADGESTDASSSTLKESWRVTTNGPVWTVFDKVANTAGRDPNATSATFTTSTSVIGPHVAGAGTATITETGVSPNNAGSYIYSTVAPTTVNFSATAPEPGMQGIMIGVQVAVLNLQKDVKSRFFTSDQFTYKIENSASGAVTSNTTSGSTSGLSAAISMTQVGAPTAHNFSESGANSTTFLNNYNSTYSCTNVISSTTALPSGTGTSFSLTPAPGDVITCTLTNTARSPSGDLEVTKTNNGGTVTSGSPTTYTIRATNKGPTSVTGAKLTDAAVTGLNVTGITCSGTPGVCTTAPTAAQLQAGYALPTLHSGQFFEIQVTGTVTALPGTSITNSATVAVPSGTTDSVSSNNKASDTDAVVGPPATCTTMYGLTSSYTTMATGGTSPILTPTDLIQEISTSGVGGAVMAKLPDIVSRNADGSLRVDAHALAISPDRRYFFIATNSTNSTDKNAFYYYDTQTGTWSAPIPLAAANAGAWQGPQRMVVTQSGIGYFSRNNYLYTFNANNPSAGIQGPYTMTAVYPNPQFPAPTPADINGGGDFVADAAGNLYVLSQPGTKDGSGNLIYDGIFDLFKITGSGSSYTATFLGRVTTTKQNNPMVTWTGMAVQNNELYVQNNLGTMLKINLGNFETTTVAAPGKQTSDLASCSYLTVAPVISSTKTVSDVNKGLVQVGDILEYTIMVRNTGNILATQATFQDAIPAGTTYVPGTTTLNGAAVADVSGVMPFVTTRSINTPGQSSGVLLTDGTTSNAATITFRVQINPDTTSVSNQGTVTTAEGGSVKTDDPSTTAANDATTTPVSPTPTILTIQKTAPKALYVKADPTDSSKLILNPAQLNYVLAVKNIGTTPATNVVVTDVLPDRLKYDNAAGLTPTVAGQTLTFTLASLAPGATQNITILVSPQITPDTIQTAYKNTATVNAQSATSNEAVTQVLYPKLSKSVQNLTRGQGPNSAVQGLPGDLLEYCIRFDNYSSLPLPNFVITDHVPGNTAVDLAAYGSGNQGIKVTRLNNPPVFLTSASDTDAGQLTNTGGDHQQGTMTVNLGTLALGENGQVCFRVKIR